MPNAFTRAPLPAGCLANSPKATNINIPRHVEPKTQQVGLFRCHLNDQFAMPRGAWRIDNNLKCQDIIKYGKGRAVAGLNGPTGLGRATMTLTSALGEFLESVRFEALPEDAVALARERLHY